MSELELAFGVGVVRGSRGHPIPDSVHLVETVDEVHATITFNNRPDTSGIIRERGFHLNLAIVVIWRIMLCAILIENVIG